MDTTEIKLLFHSSFGILKVQSVEEIKELKLSAASKTFALEPSDNYRPAAACGEGAPE